MTDATIRSSPTVSMSDVSSASVNSTNIPNATPKNNGTPVLSDELRLYFEALRSSLIMQLNTVDDLLGRGRTILPKQERERARRVNGACNQIRHDVK